DKQHGQRAAGAAMDRLHEVRDDRLRVRRLFPRQYGEDAPFEPEIEHGDQGDRDQYRHGDRAPRLLYLATEHADVVVATVVVNGDQRYGTQSQPEAVRRIHVGLEKVARHGHVEVRDTA